MKKNKTKPRAPTPNIRGNSKALPPQQLTPELCEKLQRDLMRACKDVARSHGLAVEGGDLSDIDLRHSFAIGFRVGIPMEDGALYSTDKAMFEVLAQHFGLQPSDYGRNFIARGDRFRIVAINPNRPKYPISVERVSDVQGFKFPAEDISLYLQKNSD